MRPTRGNEISGAGRVVAFLLVGVSLGTGLWGLACQMGRAIDDQPTPIDCTNTPDPEECMRDHPLWMLNGQTIELQTPRAPRCPNTNGRACL